MSKQLSIWWGGRVAGFLHLNDYGDMGFSYAPEWLEDTDQFAQDISMGARISGGAYDSYARQPWRRWARPTAA